MPGAVVTSKLDSSSIMMMCGRFTEASQSPGSGSMAGAAAWAPRASGSDGCAGGSASIQPVELNRDTATTPERARLEM